jgi:tartrate-resistant acid phosphatase type 5
VLQLSVELTRRDKRWHCERSFVQSFADGRVDLFFIDTSPFVDEYWAEDEPLWTLAPDGLRQQSWRAQLAELQRSLAISHADWKIVVGHHPPRSSGHHGDTVELIERLEPVLAAAGVQLYLSGHDHDLEHLYAREANVDYVVTGAGSECDRGFEDNGDDDGESMSVWKYPWSGFVAVTVGDEVAEVDFYTLEGGDKPVHVSRIPKKRT